MVIVGSIGAPYGVRGWVKINSFTEPADNLFGYSLWLEAKPEWQTIKIEQFKPHGNGYVAKLEQIEDRDQAAMLTNLKLAVKREDLPELEEDEYYWEDLIGLTVINEENIELGKVADCFDNGANDVLVVRGSKEHLIPCVQEDFVLEVDLERKMMRVRWDAEF